MWGGQPTPTLTNGCRSLYSNRLLKSHTQTTVFKAKLVQESHRL